MARLYDQLSAIRNEYRKRMNDATNQAQEYAAKEDMEKVSVFSTEAERMREAFAAMNRAVAIIEKFEVTDAMQDEGFAAIDAYDRMRSENISPRPTLTAFIFKRMMEAA